MTDEQLNALYEKLYFLEVEGREKIHSRLQLPLTLIVALLGGVLFIVGHLDVVDGEWTFVKVAFALFLIGSVVALMVAIVNFGRALHNNEYYFLPSSTATAEYKVQCQELYKEYENASDLVMSAMNKYIRNAYIECGTYNAAVNDRRSGYIHNCNGAVVLTAALLFITFVLFSAGGFNRGNVRDASVHYNCSKVKQFGA